MSDTRSQLEQAAEIMEALDRNEPQPHTEVEHANLAHALRRLADRERELDMLLAENHVTSIIALRQYIARLEYDLLIPAQKAAKHA